MVTNKIFNTASRIRVDEIRGTFVLTAALCAIAAAFTLAVLIGALTAVGGNIAGATASVSVSEPLDTRRAILRDFSDVLQYLTFFVIRSRCAEPDGGRWFL